METKTPIIPSIGEMAEAANDAARTARLVLTSALVVALTLAATVLGTTDEAILRETTEIIPGLGLRLSIVTAYLLAPPVFLFLHANALLQLHALIERITSFQVRLKKDVDTAIARQQWRRQIHSFAFAQIHLDAENFQEPRWSQWIKILLMRILMWASVIAAPLGLLIATQISFVRYQQYIWVHQAVVLADVVLLTWFIFAVALQTKSLMRWPLAMLQVLLLFAVSWVSLFQAVPPQLDEDPHIVRWDYSQFLKSRVTASAFSDAPIHFADYEINFPGRYVSGSDILYASDRFRGCQTSTSDPSCGSVFYGIPPIARAIWERLPKEWDISVYQLLVFRPNILDGVLCPVLRFGCRYLNLSNMILINNDAKPDLLKHFGDQNMVLDQRKMVAIMLRGRTLRFSNFQESRLYALDAIGTKFSAADLSNANLSGAKLTDAEFKEADLSLANLSDVDLKNANLQNADLTEAHLERANLTRANLDQAQLEKASLSYSNLESATLKEANLKSAHLEKANLEGANLDKADLRNVAFSDANLSDISAKETSLEGADFNGAIVSHSNMADSSGTLGSCLNVAGADTLYRVREFKIDIGVLYQKPPEKPANADPLSEVKCAGKLLAEMKTDIAVYRRNLRDIACHIPGAAETIIVDKTDWLRVHIRESEFMRTRSRDAHIDADGIEALLQPATKIACPGLYGLPFELREKATQELGSFRGAEEGWRKERAYYDNMAKALSRQK